jgi:ATP-binding cassette subfamily F protein 3
LITLRQVVLRRSARVLLDQATLTINPGEKVGLVGRNGAGKSTLFALLNGSLHEDGGDFSMPRHWRLSQVAQHMPETDESATDFVLGGDTLLADLTQQLARLEADPNADGMELAQLHADLGDAGAHDSASRAQSLILGLGFTVDQLHQPVNSFSGGWRMRLQLARALMCPADLLLLDEPTNHLDLDALVWLEGWLQRYAGTMVVISHDREFLDAVTQVTVHIENAKLNRYGGNYSAFENLRLQQMALQQAAFERQQEKVAHLQKFIDRFKAKASKARQAQSRVKALERMERVAPLLAEAEFTFEFKDPGHVPNPMLTITGADVGYQVDGSALPIVRNIGRSVLAGQRIGILGANGQGKSTLVKTIARDLAPLAGEFTEGKGLRIGYFAQQELDVLRSQDTPLEHMVRLSRELAAAGGESGTEQALRGYLGSFNFSGDMVKQTVGTMSGGEKARLVLAMIVWQRPNLLLLDEPTNHLDLSTREALSVALNEFEGSVLLVSHDRALLRSVCDEFWLVANAEVRPFDGDLDDYQQFLLDHARQQREARSAGPAAGPSGSGATSAVRESDAAPAPAVPDAWATAAHKSTSVSEPFVTGAGAPTARAQGHSKAVKAAKPRGPDLTKPLRREMAALETKMECLAQEKAALERSLLAPEAAHRMAVLGRELQRVGASLQSAEEEWLALGEQLQALEAQA